MKVLFYGLTLFCLAFFVHLAVWRYCIPNNRKKMLIQIFIGTLAIGILALWEKIHFITIFGLDSYVNLPEMIHLSLFFLSLTITYFVIYNAMVIGSVTNTIITCIMDTGLNGLDKHALEQRMRDELLLRIKCLINDKIIYDNSGRYFLTSKGILYLRIVRFYRKLMNYTDEIG
ncbi:MAG: hypothetical protein AABY43_04090 [Candidatus Omnitrophota bacterium]